MSDLLTGGGEALLLLSALLILPVALSIRSPQPLAALATLACGLALALLSGNYFWPPVLSGSAFAGVVLYRRGRFSEFVRAGGLSATGYSPVLIVVGVWSVLLIGGWLLVVLPELTRIVPILPADSPADRFDGERILLDFRTNWFAILFAAPWILLLALGLLRGASREPGPEDPDRSSEL